MLIRGLDNYIQQEPPSCPHRCPYEDECDSERTGVCLLDENAEADRYARADTAYDTARDMEFQGEQS